MKLDFTKSITESYTWRGKKFIIKRDDLLSTHINGNKAYKFYYLFNENFKNIVSFGGNQSNAMLSLSFLAKSKNANFIYFTKELPSSLKNNIDGNLKTALQNNMKLIFSNDINKDSCIFAKNNDAIFIPQGGAMQEAKEGIEILTNSILELNLKNLCVFYSSGTGTSSLFLQQYLKKYNIDVYTTPCVGSREYLEKQFHELVIDKNVYPKIICPKEKITFAKPNLLLLKIYKEWLNLGVEFDLLYDCVLWKAISDNLEIFEKYDNLLFLHSGGISGNSSQILRYKYYNMI